MEQEHKTDKPTEPLPGQGQSCYVTRSMPDSTVTRPGSLSNFTTYVSHLKGLVTNGEYGSVFLVVLGIKDNEIPGETNAAGMWATLCRAMVHEPCVLGVSKIQFCQEFQKFPV